MADADHNLPYIVEYAKSGRSKCKHCSKDIDKDEVRLGIMIQSKSNKGTNARWYHEYCFFLNAKPNKITSISGFIYLKNSDQHRLLLRIKHSAKKDQNGRKRAAEGEDFRVEYAKSGRLKCGACFKSIKNSAIQVCKNVCGTKEKELCYHLDCFADNKFNLLYFDYGEELKGMDKLKKRDQELVIEKLQEVRLSKLPWKCAKYSDEESEHIKKYKKQNILFNKCLAKLENLKDVEFENLLKANFQTVPKPRHDRLLILGDMMAFGALELCPKCTKGQLVLDTNGYRCSGTACTYVTQSPARRVMQVPAEYKNMPCFKNYTPNMEARSFLSDDVLGVDPSPSAGTGVKKQVKVHARPLKNLKFLVLEDILDGSKEISNRIKKLGGICVKSLCYDLAAYVYPEENFEDLEMKMDGVAEADDDYEYVDTIYNAEFIEENKINVVDPYFLDNIDPIKGTVKKSAEIIVESSYVDWGMDAKSILEYVDDASDYDEDAGSDDKNNDSNDENEDSDDENDDSDDENEDSDDDNDDSDDENEDSDD